MAFTDKSDTSGTYGATGPNAIDMCALVYDRESWVAYFRDLAGQAPVYLRPSAAT